MRACISRGGLHLQGRRNDGIGAMHCIHSQHFSVGLLYVDLTCLVHGVVIHDWVLIGLSIMFRLTFHMARHAIGRYRSIVNGGPQQVQCLVIDLGGKTQVSHEYNVGLYGSGFPYQT